MEHWVEAMARGGVTSAGHVWCLGAEDALARWESVQGEGHLYATSLHTILRTERRLDPLQGITFPVIAAGDAGGACAVGEAKSRSWRTAL